jgi:hypothetical protein
VEEVMPTKKTTKQLSLTTKEAARKFSAAKLATKPMDKWPEND